MNGTEIPQSSLLSRYLLENPWPLGIGLALLGMICIYIAMTRDDRNLLQRGAIALAGGGIILAIGTLYQTTAESAATATRTFVNAAADGRIDDMIDMLDSNATLHVGRPGNTGRPFDQLTEELRALEGQHRIVANRISSLNYGSNASDTAMTIFSCVTETESSYGPVPSRWMIEWRRDDTGRWTVRRITALKIAGRVPSGSILRGARHEHQCPIPPKPSPTWLLGSLPEFQWQPQAVPSLPEGLRV